MRKIDATSGKGSRSFGILGALASACRSCIGILVGFSAEFTASEPVRRLIRHSGGEDPQVCRGALWKAHFSSVNWGLTILRSISS